MPDNVYFGNELIAELVKGDSAYDVAVSNGFVGTETEWLASLQGEDGGGVPSGGAVGQVLSKASGSDFDVQWLSQAPGLDARSLLERGKRERWAGSNRVSFESATEMYQEMFSPKGGDAGTVSFRDGGMYGTSANTSWCAWEWDLSKDFYVVTSFVYQGAAPSGPYAQYIGLDCAAPGSVPSSSVVDGVGIGLQEGQVKFFKSVSFTSVTPVDTGMPAWSAVSGTTYRVTIVGRGDVISFSMRPEGSYVNPMVVRVKRSEILGEGKTLRRIFSFVQDSRGSAAGASYNRPLIATNSSHPPKVKSLFYGVVEGEWSQDFFGVSSSGVPWRIQTPVGYDPRRPVPLIVCTSQSKISEQLPYRPWSTNKDRSLVSAYGDNGYLFASLAEPDRWGNEESLQNYRELIEYVCQNYSVSSVVLLGISMGSLTALNFISHKVYPVDGLIAIGGVVSLSAIYADPKYQDDIKLAYGISSDGSDYAAKTSGYDPSLVDPGLFAGLSFHFYNGLEDTDVPPPLHSNPFVASIQGIALSAEETEVPGATHVAPATYLPDSHLDFLKGIYGDLEAGSPPPLNSTYVLDTGWVPVTIRAGFSRQGSSDPAVCRIGKVVYWRWGFSSTGMAANGSFVVADIPVAALRPPVAAGEVYTYAASNSVTAGGRFTVYSNGQVLVNTSAVLGTYYLAEANWLAV